MKKVWLNIYLFFKNLTFGLRAADKEIFGATKESSDGITNGNEQLQEQDSVYSDLLHEQVTQRVIELRHEMYFSERESKKYKYLGGGLAQKQNDIFDYKGEIDRSDGLPVQILQPNVEDTDGLSKNLGEQDYGHKNEKHFTINIERDFIPKFKIEEYTSKVVVKRGTDNKVLLDLYTTEYESQFNKVHNIFIKELERIYQGDVRSDVVDFNRLYFTSFNAYGTDDLKEYDYGNIEFVTILKFDGSYILRFAGDILKDGEDIISQFYDEETAKKCRNHEARDNASYIMTKEDIDGTNRKD